MKRLIAFAFAALATTSTLATACQFHVNSVMADPASVVTASAADDSVAIADVSTANHLSTE